MFNAGLPIYFSTLVCRLNLQTDELWRPDVNNYSHEKSQIAEANTKVHSGGHQTAATRGQQPVMN